MAAAKYFYASGKRKTSSARIFMKPGSGKITINDKPAEKYTEIKSRALKVLQPFVVTNTLGKFDAKITVAGGGVNGQTEAVRLGLARALVLFDAENRAALKKAGFLTRDSREVERKKYGKHKARRSTQFSKR